MTIIDYHFNEGSAGSFESHIFNAWKEASSSNRRRLEDAFPEFFPLARMYGAGDFRMFPTREALNAALSPLIVTMNLWGKKIEAVKLPWSEIKHRETFDPMNNITRQFRVRDRQFANYYPSHDTDVNCLGFPDRHYTHNHLWFVTTEYLQTLED